MRSLFLNERSAQAWTNLGTLYLIQNDQQLANDAFTRAQSADPDFAHAWVGQGLIALITGDSKEANLLFTHAVDISESSSSISKRLYSTSVFDRILVTRTVSNVADLVQPLFSLGQLQCLAPQDLVHEHLLALFLERIGDTAAATTTLSSISATVEADYELNESPSSLSRFALAKADVARSQLAAHNYGKAIESGETALQLSAEDAGNELSSEARQRCRLSAHLTLGLAQFNRGDLRAALEYFQLVLDESQ